MEQSKIVVVSDDAEFAQALEQSWQRLRYSPECAVCGAEEAGGIGRCAVAMTDRASALSRLQPGTMLAIVVGDETAPSGGGLRVVRIPRVAGWADQAAVLAQETLLRLESQAQLAEAKQRIREMERFAALGRFIVEARHALGNALTGVLGHSELLLLEAGSDLQAEMRSQLETIRAMSLKMQEMFHRLSSLDMELRAAERQPEWDSQRRPAQ